MSASLKSERISITPEIIERLDEIERETGYGPSAFMGWVEDAPVGLLAATITTWQQGRATTARVDHLTFVLERWPKMPPRVPVTQEWIDQIRAEQDRTGLNSHRILAVMGDNAAGLKASKISTWLSGRVKHAPKSHLDALLAAYHRIP